jgi:hypothetical protein
MCSIPLCVIIYHRDWEHAASGAVVEALVDGRLVLRSGYPYAPRSYAAGPLCTAFSFFRQLQIRSTPHRRQSPLLAREEIGREMAGKFCL